MTGRGPAKLLEYNADTPTSIFEAAVFQWSWLEQAIARQHHPERRGPVQLDPRAPDRGLEDRSAPDDHLHLAGMTENEEDAGTLAYLEDTAARPDLRRRCIDIEEIGLAR